MTTAGRAALDSALSRPRQEDQFPPCGADCPSGGDIRGWIGVVAQRHKLGLSDREAYARAWNILAATNPFPATLGRVCPHPCEASCNRTTLDGAVAINALERFLGDWALAEGLPLPCERPPGTQPESIGVIGAGPAGLSFAYQMARRGYRVSIYEQAEKAGGMLQYGIPQYRLPKQVIDSEVARILSIGIEFRRRTRVGTDIQVGELRRLHDLLFLGIGAGCGQRLGIPGEAGPGVWTGTDFLLRLNRRQPVALGAKVVVIGGGNTAVDAARAARRSGAGVTMLYRRGRSEMPAIPAEVDEALMEGVAIEHLVAPVAISRVNGVVRAVVVQRMTLGEPDGSGRRQPVPEPGSEYELETDSVIAAVSQQPDWDGLSELGTGSTWAAGSADGHLKGPLWTGGDVRALGIAGRAIGQGREAAEAAHALLRGLSPTPERRAAHAIAIKPDFYAAEPRVVPPKQVAGAWLTAPDAELHGTISEAAFLGEVSRCFSCGACFGCEQCYMYCNAGGITRLEEARPGRYFTLSLDRCEACGQCTAVCPCGFLRPS